MKKAAVTTQNNIDVDDEKWQKIAHLTSAQGEHGQEIAELVDALRKIGYFESFRVTRNDALSSDKCTNKTQRKLKQRSKARYRRIKKYCKSIRQYRKERLRRKLCWLLSGKYRETEIAEMLGISVRTVIRDMNKIKPYYFRLSRAYFRKLEEGRIREFNAQLEGATLKQQFKILTAALAKQRKLMQQREYNRHVIKFLIDLDYMQYDGFPRITKWPGTSGSITMPLILKFICIKDGQKYEMAPTVTYDYVKRRSFW